MTVRANVHRLLRFYPAAWRQRYGQELAAVLEAEADGGRITVRTRFDVAKSGIVQRLRDSGLHGDDLPPALRARAGLLLVLSSWAAFVVAGIGLQKTSEQWQAAVPRAQQGLPAAAFSIVVVGALIGTLAVLAGVLLVARSVYGLLRAGGWPRIRRPVVRAAVATGVTAVALVACVAWAHQLTFAQRNGGDLRYSAAFVVLGLCGLASIAAWTHAAVSITHALTLTRARLKVETGLAAATTLAMLVMTAAATTWWLSVADAAPGYFGAVPVKMLALVFVMVLSSSVATLGTLRSIRGAYLG